MSLAESAIKHCALGKPTLVTAERRDDYQNNANNCNDVNTMARSISSESFSACSKEQNLPIRPSSSLGGGGHVQNLGIRKPVSGPVSGPANDYIYCSVCCERRIKEKTRGSSGFRLIRSEKRLNVLSCMDAFF